MPRGRGKSETSAVKIQEFREKYLELGVARAAARAVGIPERTGCDLARRANADPEFTQLRADLRAHTLPVAEAAVLKGIEFALDGMTSMDRDGAAWFRSLVEAYKAIATVRVTMTDAGEVRPPEPTVIQYVRPESVKDADDPVPSE
jgi:hypothetical protein